MNNFESKLQNLRHAREISCKENEVFLREMRKTERGFNLSERHVKNINKLKDLDAKDTGIDVERMKGVSYSLKNVDDWQSRKVETSVETKLDIDFGLRAWNSYRSSISYLNSMNGGAKGKDRVLALANVVDSKRNKNSKRRRFDPEQDYTFINVRNQKFNQKLERAYELYTTNIRESLEQG
jgi:hypothetical protein